MRFTALPVAVAFASLAGGCAAPVETAPEGQSESAASASTAGTYEVPVEGPIAPFSTNPVSVKFLPIPGGKFRLKYDLPAVIAGPAKEVDLVATETAPGEWSLTGTSGTGTCKSSATGAMTCQEHLTGVGVDFAQASAAVEALGAPASETEARIAVAKQFSIDPLGILRFAPRATKGKKNRGGRDD